MADMTRTTDFGLPWVKRCSDCRVSKSGHNAGVKMELCRITDWEGVSIRECILCEDCADDTEYRILEAIC